MAGAARLGYSEWVSISPGGMPALVFASPRGLPKASRLEGRVVVLDIAFAASSSRKVSYEKVTLKLIEGLGERLAAWVDHHDHERGTCCVSLGGAWIHRQHVHGLRRLRLRCE